MAIDVDALRDDQCERFEPFHSASHSIILKNIGSIPGGLSGKHGPRADNRCFLDTLFSSDPSHAERARDVSVSLLKIGIVHAEQGDPAHAQKLLREGRAIVAKLHEAVPEIHILADDLANFDAAIARFCPPDPAS